MWMEAGRRGLATLAAVTTVLVLVVLIYVGSDELRNFDSALVGYAFGTVFAAAGLAYRSTLWVGRPPTWRYFSAGWRNFLSWRNFRRYSLLIPRAWWTDIFAQTFILRRSFARWVMHLSIFWGVIISLLITVPLTFGWFRFTFEEPDDYRVWFFGFSTVSFPLETVLSWVILHGLDFSAVLLLIGVGIAFWRRSTDAGLLATQSYSWDLLPLILLFAIAVTGLALTASSLLWEGQMYWFIALTHQVVVVVWLMMLPFGKFFHAIERPATIGVTLYQAVTEGHERDAEVRGDSTVPRAACASCGRALPSRQFITDLKGTLDDLGQRYELGGDRGVLQDYCPSCKRLLRGRAYFQEAGKRFV